MFSAVKQSRKRTGPRHLRLPALRKAVRKHAWFVDLTGHMFYQDLFFPLNGGFPFIWQDLPSFFHRVLPPCFQRRVRTTLPECWLYGANEEKRIPISALVAVQPSLLMDSPDYNMRLCGEAFFCFQCAFLGPVYFLRDSAATHTLVALVLSSCSFSLSLSHPHTHIHTNTFFSLCFDGTRVETR